MTAVAVIAFGAFAAVLGAVEMVTWHGQLDFGHHVIKFDDNWVYVVPTALEGSALASAAMSLWAVLDGDSAALTRLMTAGAVMAAAYASWQGAEAAGRPMTAASYMAGCSVAALLMWHVILTRIRRTVLRSLGVIEKPLPRFRAIRWVVAFSETRDAWMLAVRDGIYDADEALKIVRKERAPLPPPPNEYELNLATMSKREAIEAAASIIRSFEPAEVRAWLAEQNPSVTVDKSYTAQVLRDLKGNGLRALPGGADS